MTLKAFQTGPPVVEDVVSLAHRLGFQKVKDDINDLLDSHGQELSNKDLMELEQRRARREETAEAEPESVLTTTTTLSEFFSLL